MQMPTITTITIGGDVIGDVDIPDANEVEVHASASKVDACKVSEAGGSETKSAAGIEATQSTDDSVMNAAAQDDTVDEAMQDASPSNDNTASSTIPVQGTDSFSTDVTSTEMEDATPTSPVASSTPVQAAPATPAASIVAAAGLSQPPFSSLASDVNMTGVNKAESLPQAPLHPKQPAFLRPGQRGQKASSSAISDSAADAQDVEMAFGEFDSLFPASFTPTTDSDDAMDIAADGWDM